MSTPFRKHRARCRRVATLLAWIAREVERRDTEAAQAANPDSLWPSVGSMAHVEAELRTVFSFIAGVTEDDVTTALRDEGLCDD